MALNPLGSSENIVKSSCILRQSPKADILNRFKMFYLTNVTSQKETKFLKYLIGKEPD